ncbi:MAG: hypothetical protein IKU37_08650 [Candidatus Gastranaerophilales bacterium]|nr:hypothetical protein [Candidatus Gastranaerophilales bacterium]
MEKYVHIFYDKQRRTQRFVLSGAEDCLAKIEEELKDADVPFTNSKWVGKYEPLKDFKSQTHKYAKDWRWLGTVDLTLIARIKKNLMR